MKTASGGASRAPQESATLAMAREVLEIEAKAVSDLIGRLDHRFAQAVELILNSHGRVVVSGIGKSGHIARKIASTLASTGTPAFFVHPAEASHGDLGMVAREDVLIALSNSGESDELMAIVPLLKRQGAKLIAMTGNPQSTLAREADVHLYAGAEKEACPLNLAPTASTTAALALGDALAMTLLVRKGFSEAEFASFHPGGKIGRRLLRVENAMHGGEAAPVVGLATPMPEVIHEMSSKRLGMTCVVDDDRRLAGVVTDGDLRRLMSRTANVLALTAADAMSPRPVTIPRQLLAVEALNLMEARKITSIVVVDDHGLVEGVVHLHDLWRTQMV